MRSELERIAMLAAQFGKQPSPHVTTGIGDDAAVLGALPATNGLVWTIDAQVEGTHFRREWLSWNDVGFRSFMAAASDLAAMGARPIAALSSLVLPVDLEDEALDAIAAGQAEAARQVDAPIVGGNLARDPSHNVSITTTLLGHAEHPVTRTGAKAGDGIFLGGAVGMAAAGLALLQHSSGAAMSGGAGASPCIEAWRRPRARIDLGRSLGSLATSAIDISDGLARDAWHLALGSNALLVIDERLLRSVASEELAAAGALLQRDVFGEWILGGGEDYALLVTSASPSSALVERGFVRIGAVESSAAAPGVVLAREEGSRVAVSRAGFDHFFEWALSLLS